MSPTLTNQNSDLSFGIISCRDYFNELVKKNLETFKADPQSKAKAISASVITWHLYDWTWESHSQIISSLLPSDQRHKGGYLKFLLKVSCLDLLYPIAQGAKHLNLTDAKADQVTDTSLRHGYLNGGLLGLGTSSHLVVTDKNSIDHFFMDILQECVDYWDKFLSQELKI